MHFFVWMMSSLPRALVEPQYHNNPIIHSPQNHNQTVGLGAVKVWMVLFFTLWFRAQDTKNDLECCFLWHISIEQWFNLGSLQVQRQKWCHTWKGEAKDFFLLTSRFYYILSMQLRESLFQSHLLHMWLFQLLIKGVFWKEFTSLTENCLSLWCISLSYKLVHVFLTQMYV